MGQVRVTTAGGVGTVGIATATASSTTAAPTGDTADSAAKIESIPNTSDAGESYVDRFILFLRAM